MLRSIMETLVRPFLVLVFLGMTMNSRCVAVEAWAEIVQRIESQRVGIVNGKATASGVETDLDGDVLPVKMAWLFDDSQSAFAFIRTCPAIESHDKESTFGVWSFADRRLFYTNHDGIPTVAVELPNEKRSKGKPGSRGFLDPRLFGLIPQFDFYDCLSPKLFLKELTNEFDDVSTGDGLLRFQTLWRTKGYGIRLPLTPPGAMA